VPAAAREHISGPLASAFGHTFLWAAAMAALAIVPAVALLRAERAGRRQRHGSGEPKRSETVRRGTVRPVGRLAETDGEPRMR
jgi:hypothetical protein